MILTVATATWNVAKTSGLDGLVRCIESVARLKTPHEHLIFDGGSQDGTLDVLLDMESRIETLKVVSERDSGIYNALNKAVRSAQGEWFNVLGSDDYISHPETLDRILAETPNDVDVIVAQSEVAGVADGFYFDRIHISTPYCHQGVFAKTVLVRSLGGFDERYKVSADFDMMLKWHERGCNIRYVNEPIAFFAKGGFCQKSGGALGHENLKIAADHFGLNERERRRLERYSVIPIRVVKRHLSHPDAALRKGARYMRRRYYLSYLMSVFYPVVVARRWLLGKSR